MQDEALPHPPGLTTGGSDETAAAHGDSHGPHGPPHPEDGAAPAERQSTNKRTLSGRAESQTRVNIAKDKKAWVEKTIVSKGLTMAEAVKEAIALPPVAVNAKGVGPVLKAVVKTVAAMRAGVRQWRKDVRYQVKRIAKSLDAVNAQLHLLVPPHGKEICADMHFAFLYVAGDGPFPRDLPEIRQVRLKLMRL